MTTPETAAPDMINRPPHYVGVGGLEAIDVLELYDLGLHLGTAMAYLLRAGRKGPAAEDLRKARWWMVRWFRDGCSLAIARSAALEWRTPDEIVLAFGLSGAHADLTRRILYAAVFDQDQDFVAEMRLVLRILDAAIAEAEAAAEVAP